MRLVIIDWDDTCLPTTFLDTYVSKYFPPIRDICFVLSQIETQLLLFLMHIKECDDVLIFVTNAKYRWIQDSRAKYFPNISKMIMSHYIISARDMYENQFETIFWKHNVFLDLMNKFQPDELISIGDRYYEMSALKLARKVYKKCITKNIKLPEQLSHQELLSVLKKLNDTVKLLWKKTSNIDIEMHI